MADIIRSRDKNQHELMAAFKKITDRIKKTKRASFLSPITITLGDEFQSIPMGLSESIDIIFDIEEAIILSQSDFKLRYTLVKGEVDTPINTKSAHEMMGSGLTRARQCLEILKKRRQRFEIHTGDPTRDDALNNSFVVFQALIDGWRLKDHDLIGNFIRHMDYKIVADKMGKTRSQIWKREKTLMIKEYFALKKTIAYIGGQK